VKTRARQSSLHSHHQDITLCLSIQWNAIVVAWDDDCTLAARGPQGPPRHLRHQFAFPCRVMCGHLFCLCYLVCRYKHNTGWSPLRRVAPTVYRIKKLKNRPMSNKGAEEPLIMMMLVAGCSEFHIVFSVDWPTHYIDAAVKESLMRLLICTYARQFLNVLNALANMNAG
jgi:hypothetical protein